MSHSTVKTDATHDPERTTWVDGASGHADFPIQNLPLGIFTPPNGRPHAGSAIGDFVVDLAALAAANLLPGSLAGPLSEPTLNALLALPAAERTLLRTRLSDLLSDEKQRAAVTPHLHRADTCTMQLPATIGDYTDFYVGIHHAMNVGRQFRPDQPLLPNYKHVPIGYHGRASSVRASGEIVRRPNGQRKPPSEENPTFGPARRLDYELELGIWIGAGNELGHAVPIAEAREHIAGLCLLNDWSARDLQAWEYQPLGPFLAKSFHTTVSPWIVTTDALLPFRIPQAARPEGDPRPLAYLWDERDQAEGALALELEVSIASAKMRAEKLAPLVVSRSAARHMYWTFAQIVTHHASNGCNLRAGDLLGTGTISAPEREGFGSLLETTKGGAEPISLPSGETRTFLEDGDEVTLRARAVAPGFASIGFGSCSGVIGPAAS